MPAVPNTDRFHPARTKPSIAAITATRPTTVRVANVRLWTLQVLLAAAYGFSAAGKRTADAQNVARFEAMGLGTTGMYVIGVLEPAGVIAQLRR